MKRRILLVDDDVAVLLTMKAVLEISGFEVETAASAREGKHKLRTREYHMVITDMRMESEASGAEVIAAARSATYHPAVALLTAFPIEEDDWQGMGADKMLVKPMHVRVLLQQIEKLMESHEQKLKIWNTPPPKASAVEKKAVANKAAHNVIGESAPPAAAQAKRAQPKKSVKKAATKKTARVPASA